MHGVKQHFILCAVRVYLVLGSRAKCSYIHCQEYTKCHLLELTIYSVSRRKGASYHKAANDKVDIFPVGLRRKFNAKKANQKWCTGFTTCR